MISRSDIRNPANGHGLANVLSRRRREVARGRTVYLFGPVLRGMGWRLSKAHRSGVRLGTCVGRNVFRNGHQMRVFLLPH